MFEKYAQELAGLEKISQAAGNSHDLVQGGGGNTSVKLDGDLMAVKASGFKLKQITATTGYVVVNYKNIKAWYGQVDLSTGRDYEKESTEFVKANIIAQEGVKPLRPSVEAGFHSFLKKYVIHSHSVYANIVCCTHDGERMAGELAKQLGKRIAWIPYINPGFFLSLSIQEALKAGPAEIILMENHGLIVTTDDPDSCVKLHDEVNTALRAKLAITEPYPAIVLKEAGENEFHSDNPYIIKFVKENGVKGDYFDKYPLYPDQLVYLNGNISVDGPDAKLTIDTKKSTMIFRTGGDEARTIEETLLGYFYVLDMIKKRGLSLKTMTAKEVDYIHNWESEAYRKSLLNKK